MEQVQIDPSLCKDLVLGNVTFRSACDFHLTEADLEIAREELGETEDVKKKTLEELKEMISKDKHIIYRTDDAYLMRFLRYRKFDAEKTYKYLKGFYTLRNENPRLFTMPSDLEERLKGNSTYIMPYTFEEGSVIFVFRLGDWNVDETNMRDFLNMYSCLSKVVTMNPHAQINGVVGLWDFKGVTMDHYMAIVNPLMGRFYAKFAQDAYPWRIKKTVLFNCSTLVYSGLSIARVFLKKKIAERIVPIHSDLNELHRHFDPAILPEVYGGRLSNEECFAYSKKWILSNKDYMQYENSFIGRFK